MAKLSAELQRYFLDAPSLTPTPHETAAAEVSSTSGDVTLNELLTLSGERTFGFLFVVLSLPSALPIPAPGYSIPFGIVMLLLAVQLIIGRKKPWLPQGWMDKGFERTKVAGFITKGLPWLQKIEAVSRPRLSIICTSPVGRLILGIAIALMSTCMLIPIPGTNTLPAIGIFIIGFGLLDDDGAISLAGLTLCTLAVGLVGSIIFFGAEAVDGIKDQILGR
ncbi:exopolysaccharide biosynthesis protein [Leptolyngbya cf. ectocarpi LEGE 11479]|uniref:Exopolysaccharide biosynthesis protein n=1 Tax=Leptolyngbya cf. ectocarpi LEGE 11479 TaxID=1828722 RepID=A0A929FAD0_LEPEC|nr:exopolysaccharide biosynthesis protein [Leptolyngbya ectocarpi]MBE9068094.1 exopolysaccharide biosynthesis protein [Leptolyngbya cf. ectocarpi LEGE 11479]